MHIEKNVFDNVFHTVMNVKGTNKNKDSVKSQLDVHEYCNRPQLHLVEHNGKVLKPKANYALQRDEQRVVCEWVQNLKLPDGFASNVANCVDLNENKLCGLKSHDCHIFMECLMPIAFSLLPHTCWKVIAELSIFFRHLCSATLFVNKVQELEESIAHLICRLERIFPPTFFDCMEHLPIHLPYEARLGGPVQYRWMYPFERFLNFLKRKIKNKSRVEGSICEAFIIEETTTFASYYFEAHVQSRHTRIGRNLDDGGVNNATSYLLSVFNLPGRLMGASSKRYMDEKEANAAHQHILLNCEEVQPILRMFEDGLSTLNPGITNVQVDKEVENYFAKWFQTYVNHYRDGLQNKFLIDLACGPLLGVKTYSGYIVNGYKFQTYSYCNGKSTPNSGVCVKGTGLAEGEADFYGILNEIVEIEYPNLPIKKVVLFKCEWFDPKPNIGTRVLSEYGIVEVRQNRRYQKYDPFILAQNASQVYYLPYPRGAKDKSNWSAVINVRSRGTFDDQYKLNTAFQQEVIPTVVIGHAEYEEDQEDFLHEPYEMEEVDGSSLFEGNDEHINDNNDIDSESELEGSFDDIVSEETNEYSEKSENNDQDNTEGEDEDDDN